jgi:predicted phosphodiesterase
MEENMNDFLIAHLSDLHFTLNRYFNEDEHSQTRILDALSSSLKEIKPNLFIISGDLSDDHNGTSMINARDWIYSNYDNGIKNIGLMQNKENVIIVPGNKDISNPENLNTEKWLEKSHVAFNNVFYNYQKNSIRELDNCKYYWICTESVNLFIVCLDSSYLGKDHSQKNKDGLPVNEKRKVFMKQTEILIKWFSLGYKGQLKDNYEKIISSKDFINSVKILVSHHYIYYPKNDNEYFFGTDDRNTIFGNIVLSDFDILLCGHKHRADYEEYICKEKLDYRAKSRYLFNYLRLHLGCDALPLQFDDAGKKYSRKLTVFIQLLIGKSKIERERKEEDNILEKVIDSIDYGLEHPNEFVASFSELIKKYDLMTCANITQEEINSLVFKLKTEYTKDDLKSINHLAKITLDKYFKDLSKKKFYQILVGSSAKEITNNTGSSRAFNVYHINKNNNITTIDSEKYKYTNGEFILQSELERIIPYVGDNII